MKNLKNITIRKQIISAGLSYKDIACEMGIKQSTLSHYLGYDLRPHVKNRIEQAIATLKDRNSKKNECT